MEATKDKLLEELDDVCRQLRDLSGHLEYLRDELDPTWRKRKEKARKKFLKDFRL